MTRRRHEVVEQEPRVPGDDPYADYLAWKAERDAEAAALAATEGGADAGDGTVSADASGDSDDAAVRGGWLRRITALGHVNAARGR
ncbi:hypothetical protein [Agromyces marinus]|nr:hypothetical protein [Agromyces marinus]